MKICVIGAGAIGGLLAARLACSGQSLSILARGATLAALRANGLILEESDGSRLHAQVVVSDRPDELGVQDVIILGVKAHQVASVTGALPALRKPETIIIPAQNGIPWWYFHKYGGALEGRTLESVDRDGQIARAIPAECVLATVVYPAAEILAPGVIRHIEGSRFSLAELDGTKSARAEMVAQTLRAAGFKAPIVSDVRSEIWTKLWGNLSFNPISALTHADLATICRDPGVRALATEMMKEAQRVGEALGAQFRVPIEKRLAGAEAVGAHKTSMLQDLECGRALEIEALLGAVLELAAMTQIATPACAIVYSLVKLLDATVRGQNGRLRVESIATP